MNNSDETSKQPDQNDPVLQAIAELSKKIDDYKKDSDAQFEVIRQRFDAVDGQFEAVRQGIVHNSVSFDRLKAEVLMLRADAKELAEEIRHNKKVLV
jgi:chromosome segregation ATPase